MNISIVSILEFILKHHNNLLAFLLDSVSDLSDSSDSETKKKEKKDTKESNR